MLNINEGNNLKLMEACDTLKSYSIFVALVRKYIKEIPKDTDDKEELHNKTIATEATEKATIKAALEMIRFGREESIQDGKTRLRIKNLGLSDATIDELFAQVDAENATLVP